MTSDSDAAAALLAETLLRHGAQNSMDHGWVRLTASGIRFRGTVFRQQSQRPVVQLDVDVALPTGRVILESFTGWGSTFEEAIESAHGAFVLGSLHVLLVTLLTAPDEQVEQETWTIDGVPRTVTIGPIVGRGSGAPAEQNAWFPEVKRQLSELRLTEGLHWVRVFHAQNGSTATCEVLVDNAVSESLQRQLASAPWPKADGYSSVRVFLTIRHGFDVGEAAQICARAANEPEEVWRAAMIAGGASPTRAERLAAFLPLAFGRVALDGLAPQFDDRAFVESIDASTACWIRLCDEPVYAEALQLAFDSRRQGTWAASGYTEIATRSSEFRALNDALNAGAKTENLEIAPPFLSFSEATAVECARNAKTTPPTTETTPNASVADPMPTRRAKPWWRFW